MLLFFYLLMPNNPMIMIVINYHLKVYSYETKLREGKLYINSKLICHANLLEEPVFMMPEKLVQLLISSLRNFLRVGDPIATFGPVNR